MYMMRIIQMNKCDIMKFNIPKTDIYTQMFITTYLIYLK